MTNKDAEYWFPAKRYGWGWGAPRTWQGWAVLASFAVLVALGVVFLRPLGTTLFIAYIVALGVVLTAVCWLKGEPPRWRWGGK
ncbi:MAG TPA: hypothetical protein VN201_11940 [Roseateles sp.]|nr:hypothetical protein [Roseateles sp.]